MTDLTQTGQRAMQKSAGIYQAKSPFKQAFQTQALGGARQRAAGIQRQQKLVDVGKLAGQGMQTQYQQAKKGIQQEGKGIERIGQESLDEMQEASWKAQRDLENYRNQIFQTTTALKNELMQQVRQANENLQGYVDEQTLQNRSESAAKIIDGLFSGVSMIAGVKNKIADKRAVQQERFESLQQKTPLQMTYGQPYQKGIGDLLYSNDNQYLKDYKRNFYDTTGLNKLFGSLGE